MTAVLHVITSLGLGGAERMLVQLAGGLQSRGLTQHVVGIGTHDDYAEELKDRGVAVTLLGVPSVARGLGGLIRLLPVIRRLQPRLLHGWMYHGNLMAALAHRMAGDRRSRRLMWNLRASNMDDARYGWIIRAGALLSSWPDVVVANSAAGMGHHLGRGYRPKRAEVIPNGIDTGLFRPDPAVRAKLRAQLGIGPDAVVAVCIARVDAMKDHATFLAAMTRQPKVTGLLVGRGTQNLTLPANVRALGPRRDVADVAACADLLVSSSAFGEGFSNVIAEGMSAGLVPVVTDVGDARMIVGSTGTVVAPRDAGVLAAAIGAEADRTVQDRQGRGQLARERIVENFGLEKCIDAYAQLYALS